MRLLHRDNASGAIRLTDDLVKDIPRYAILSHRWGHEEVVLQDLNDGSGPSKHGYRKIRFCGEQAWRDGLSYFWVDTCCIDKKNAVELQEAINSMFSYYRKADRCYVFLDDVSLPDTQPANGLRSPKRRRIETGADDGPETQAWDTALRKSLWFTRGWTLQELLAPSSVEFFSSEGTLLGNKRSLEQIVCEVTRIPVEALRDRQLSEFSVDDRLSWMDYRETTREEDMAYAMLGILGVRMRLDYGEGRAEAFRRLRKKTDQFVSNPKFYSCLKDLRTTDPRLDKKRIEDTKGGLLTDTYRWVLENDDFKHWRYGSCGSSDRDGQLLWVRGDPGKGKTMLLCGIIDELSISTEIRDPESSAVLSYFFCQATDSRINNASAVLRGLIYMLIDQQPMLISHVQKKYDQAGKLLFEDVNAWAALTEILRSILADPNLQKIYLVIDALDECGTVGANQADRQNSSPTGAHQSADLSKLLRFIAQNSTLPKVKWLLSSRNWPSIEEHLAPAIEKATLSLELNHKSISEAVATYIHHKVGQLAEAKKYSNELRQTVCDYFLSHANDTFLWVALVCETLFRTSRRNTLSRLREFPAELGNLYDRMMSHLLESEDAVLCRDVLATVSTTYRPVTLCELACLIDLSDEFSDDESLTEIVHLCGSFLTLRNQTIFFVHQSAKDYILQAASKHVFPSGTVQKHRTIFARSLQIMSRVLQRDIYRLGSPGFSIERVEEPSPDPLAAVRYSCIYWIDHLRDCDSPLEEVSRLQNSSMVDTFLREKYLYWLEALSLLRSMSHGVRSMIRLVQLQNYTDNLTPFVWEASRFIQSFSMVIENYPLQTYVSALVFSPTQSLVRGQFRREEPRWLAINQIVDTEWSACLTTLDGHDSAVRSVAWSPDGTRIASASWDGTVKIWDPVTSQCETTLQQDDYDLILCVAWSTDGTRLASVSHNNTVRIWDPMTGRCEAARTEPNYRSCRLRSVSWSPDGALLALASIGYNVKIWDFVVDRYKILRGHSKEVQCVAWSADGSRLASASVDESIRIWDPETCQCEAVLRGHSESVASVAWSTDGTRIASASSDTTVKVWDPITSQCTLTLHGHDSAVNSVAWSTDGRKIASASRDRTIRIWDLVAGQCEATLHGHGLTVYSVAWSADGTRLASSSSDNTVKVWVPMSSPYRAALDGHSKRVRYVNWSRDGNRLASASEDETIRIWDPTTGQCKAILQEDDTVNVVTQWSTDDTRLASASDDRIMQIWNPITGECEMTLGGHLDSVDSLAWSTDDTLLASASNDRTTNDTTIKIWDLATGECKHTLNGHSDPVWLVAWSIDSTRLASVASVGRDNVIIWDPVTGQCMSRLTVPDCTSLEFDSYQPDWLHTNAGTLDLGTLTEAGVSIVPSHPSNPLLRAPGYEIDASWAWIRYRGENLIWLPPDYRSEASAVFGEKVAIGCRSGRVLILRFSPRD